MLIIFYRLSLDTRVSRVTVRLNSNFRDIDDNKNKNTLRSINKGLIY